MFHVDIGQVYAASIYIIYIYLSTVMTSIIAAAALFSFIGAKEVSMNVWRRHLQQLQFWVVGILKKNYELGSNCKYI